MPKPGADRERDGNATVTIVRIVEYLDAKGRSPYADWFGGLNAVAGAKVAMAIYRLAAGNFSNVKGVGSGVFERRVDFGPGYRIYFGKEGGTVVVLLGGSSKQQQSRAIALARDRWSDYARRPQDAKQRF